MMPKRSSRSVPPAPKSAPRGGDRQARPRGFWHVAVLAAAVALFLSPYLFGGRSLVPLELMTLFEPWGSHARSLWSQLPEVHNPLLDSLQQYLPRRAYLAEALREGWLPLWWPHQYGGTPFLAMQQGTVLYPPAWLLSLLPPELQFGWSALFHLFVAGAGTFLFLRLLGLREAAALAGGLAFTFNGYVVVWLAYPNVTQWTMCWLPLALYCWERGFRADDLRWMGGAAAVLALSILGGHGQSSEYGLLTWGLWALTRTVTMGGPVPARVGGVLRWIVLPGSLLIALSLGHLLPSLDYLPRTDRGARLSWEAVQGTSMPASQLWTLLLPRLFGDGTLPYGQASWLPALGKQELQFVERTFYPGASVLVLAIGALALPWRRRSNPDAGVASGVGPEGETERSLRDQSQLRLFACGLTVLSFVLALGTALYWPFWRFVPGFSQFTAVARVVCMAALPLASLAALGVHGLTHPDPERRRRVARLLALAAVFGSLTALVGHFLYADLIPEAVEQLLARRNQPSVPTRANWDLLAALGWMIAPAFLAFLTLWRPAPSAPAARRRGLSPELAGVLAAAIVLADLFWFGFGFNPRAETRYLHATTPEIHFLRQRQQQEEPFRFLSAGPPGDEMSLRHRMPSNLPAWYGLADLNGSDSFVPLRYRAWEAATRAASGGESPWSRFGMPNLRSAGVRYYLSDRSTSRPDENPVLREAFPGAGSLLREDPEALPYARVHSLVRAMPSDRELLQALHSPDRFPAIAMTEGPEAPEYDGPPAVVPFTTRRLNGNRLILEGETTHPGLLVVCEQFEPGWRARVNGDVARVIPADHLWVGVPVPAGKHRVELTYEPGTFRVGAFGMLLALAALCGLFAGCRRDGAVEDDGGDHRHGRRDGDAHAPISDGTQTER